jgi:hypothetical protein|tara:strand:+ start:3928 stop:4104 length:177 start_codon:yes stop_codon:yes gene_type:complete
MPQLGNEKTPIIMTKRKTGRTLGLMGRWYTKENREKYAEGYKRIYGDKKKTTTSRDSE